MIRYSNVFDNSNMLLIEQGGAYFVYEHQMDRSNSAMSAANAYFMREMNVKKRQVLVQLNGTAVRMQAGAMQWMTGNISMRTGLNVGNFIGKAIKAKVTGESLTKPIYEGAGCIMLEPRELTVPDGISANTLKDMDRAIENFKMGDVSPAIDLSDF